MDQDVKINVGNKAFVDQGLSLKADYSYLLTELFNSGIETVNFGNSAQTAKIINLYVDDSTNGLIEKIVEPDAFDSDTRLLLHAKPKPGS